MDILKAYLLRNYWRRTFLTANTLTTFLSALGLFWLLTEISAFVEESWKSNLQSLWTYFFLLSVTYTLWRRRPVISACERLNGSDILIEVRIGDIFDIPSAMVISTNTTFDTNVNEKLISKRSLQGEFTRRFYDNCAHLDTDIASALKDEEVISTRESKVGGKRDKYRIGTVAKVSPKDKTTYLLAIAELNENGVAESSFESVKQSLAELWGFVSSKGTYEPLVIPILGTGHGRIKTPRDVVIREVVKSFVAACSERRFTNKLTIIIASSDYHDHDLDIYELGAFLQYVCRYTEISPKHQGRGEPVGDTLDTNSLPAFDHTKQLSIEASQILDSAARNDGTVLMVRTLGGLVVQVNNCNLVLEGNARAAATWQSAVEELLALDLLIAVGDKNEVLQVTRRGYEVADRLILNVLATHTS